MEEEGGRADNYKGLEGREGSCAHPHLPLSCVAAPMTSLAGRYRKDTNSSDLVRERYPRKHTNT